MAQRGVEVSYESVRSWCEKFGLQYAKKIRRQRGPMGDTWHLDEVYLKINDQQKYLWRAVDQEGQVLDILVQAKRNKLAAEYFFKKVLRGTCHAPREVVTDKLTAYVQPCAHILPSTTHIRYKGANNRAENSHQPTNPSARTPNEALQVRCTGAKISVNFQRSRQLVCTVTPYRFGRQSSIAAQQKSEYLVKSHTSWTGLMKGRQSGNFSSSAVNLTMPYEVGEIGIEKE